MTQTQPSATRLAPSYEESVVVLLDILGFSEMVKGAPDPVRSLDALKALKRLREIAPAQADFYAFSDTVLLVLRLPGCDAERDLRRMAAIVWASRSQEALLDEGFMVQGGISRGMAYSDSAAGIVVGPALVDAYHCASKDAHVARVVVQESVIIDEWKKPESLRDNSPVDRMNDGVWFVDYLKTPVLNFIPSSTFDAQARLLERNRGALLEYASRARTTADLARCTWALWYHNTWVRRMLWPANAEWAKNVLEERSRLEALLIPELEFRARTRPAQPTSSPSSGETARGS